MNQHDDIDDEDGWECPTCLRPMQDEHDYECGTCEAKASEHIRVTTMCKLLRASQTRESCLIVERDRLRDRLAAMQAELEAAKRKNNSIARWIENNCADGLIDSMPLVDQINSIYERQLGKAEKAKRQLTSERALADRLAALLHQLHRDAYGGQQADPQCDCCDCEYLRPIDDALAAWKEARSE